jgi:hypothetical protein
MEQSRSGQKAFYLILEMLVQGSAKMASSYHCCGCDEVVGGSPTRGNQASGTAKPILGPQMVQQTAYGHARREVISREGEKLLGVPVDEVQYCLYIWVVLLKRRVDVQPYLWESGARREWSATCMKGCNFNVYAGCSYLAIWHMARRGDLQ